MSEFNQKVKFGTPIVWKNAGGDGVITLKNRAADSYVQGAKVDLGEKPADAYVVRLKTALAVAPAAGAPIRLWVAGSPHATAGTDNPVNLTGADGLYTGYDADAANAVAQLNASLAGVLASVAKTATQVADIGIWRPLHRYAIPLYHNGTAQATKDDDADHEIVLYPIIPVVEEAP